MVRGLDAYGTVPAGELGPYAFVGRYVSEQPGKCITPAEVAAYHRAKKSIILVYEDNASDGLGGTAMGEEKASIARPILAGLGCPSWVPVHFAFDMPGYQADLPAFLDCTLAFAATLGRPAAAYGDVDTCSYLGAHGVRYLWQFGEGQAPGVTVLQGPPTTASWGQPIDPDTALAASYGQWAPPKPKPKEEEMVVLTKDPNNGGEIVLDLATGRYYGLSNPQVLAYYKTCGVKEVSAPSKAVFAKFSQGGTI